MFFVWFNAVKKLNEGPELGYYRENKHLRHKWLLDTIIEKATIPFRILTIILIIYAIVNFILFLILTRNGSVDIIEHKYVIASHGRIIREISEFEYLKGKALELRGMTGHLLIFYSIGINILWPRK